MFKVKLWAVCAMAAMLGGCSAPSQGANETIANQPSRVIAGDEYMAELRDKFVEVSGKDFVEFAEGSASLSAAAKFRLERQALWLRANPWVFVRLVASGDGAERVADRRLAMSRASAVQRYLVWSGVDVHQVAGIDVEPVHSGNRQRVLTDIDLIQSAQND